MNQNADFMTNRLTGAHAKAGYVTEISITPTQQIASENFKELSEEKRKCRLPHEIFEKDFLFTTYTQESCEYMCMLRNMSQTQTCLPWDILNINGNMTICHGRMAYRVITAIETYNPTKDPNCVCPPDCEKISFNYEYTSYSIDEDKDCSQGLEGMDFLETAHTRLLYNTIQSRTVRLRAYILRTMIDDMQIGMPELDDKYWKAYHDGNFFRRFSDVGVCKQFTVENHAYIIMYIREPTMIQLIKDVRLSFDDKLGIFGGTIGVFTGISFITMMELIYWVLIAVIERFKVTKMSPTFPTRMQPNKVITPAKVIDITPVETALT